MTIDGRHIDAFSAHHPAINSQWINYVPVISPLNGTGSYLLNTANYTLLNPKTVLFNVTFLVSGAGTGSGAMNVSVPVKTNPLILGTVLQFNVFSAMDTSNNYALAALFQPMAVSNAFPQYIYIYKYDGSFPGILNAQISVSGFYGINK